MTLSNIKWKQKVEQRINLIDSRCNRSGDSNIMVITIISDLPWRAIHYLQIYIGWCVFQKHPSIFSFIRSFLIRIVRKFLILISLFFLKMTERQRFVTDASLILIHSNCSFLRWRYYFLSRIAQVYFKRLSKTIGFNKNLKKKVR